LAEGLNKGFRLGAVEVKPADCVVVADGQAKRVEPKVMDVLLALAASGGSTVSREQLIAAVWPRGYVTDDALNRCISNLRAALGDKPREPRYIFTVPRKGYRLALAAVPLEPLAGRQGLLVLPFQNLSPTTDSYIVDGLTELLIARLAVALDQPVISRTTAMTFKNSQRDLTSISGQLGVRWVVEGSVLQMGEQVQIVVQLIDAETDSHCWAETWTRPVSDMLTVLNEISRLVAGLVRTKLRASEPKPVQEQSLPTDLLRQYLHGVYLNSKRTHASLRQAAACFERVLGAIPDHVPALSGLAQTHVLLAHYGALSTAEGFGKARQYAEAALDLEPESQEPLAHLAAVSFFYDWDFERAARRIERVLAIHPGNEIGRVMAANIDAVNRCGERALSHIDRALEVDPLNIGLLMNSGDHLILQHRFGEAAHALAAALDIDPSFRPARLRLAMALAFDGRQDDALACLSVAGAERGEDAAYYEYLAIARGALGLTEDAADAARRLENQTTGVTPWALARAWASAGDSVRAIRYLRAAFDARSSSVPFLGVTPVFRGLRKLPEIKQLMDKLGLS